MNNLAALYGSEGKYGEAEPLYRRLLTILEKTPGREHPNVATVLESYSALLRKMGREDKAVEQEARASAIRAIGN